MSNSYDYLRNFHDLSLPDWGPYAHDLFTLSHITNKQKGFRLDFVMVPSLYRRAIFPPETLRECGYSPWEASGDFGYYSARQQLVAKDMFYSETSYSRIDDTSRLGRIAFVNNTDEPQLASVFLFARFAPEATLEPQLPAGATWLDAIDYVSLEYARRRPDHNLIFNGDRRGVEGMDGTVGGCALGNPHNNCDRSKCFGYYEGDRAQWNYVAQATAEGRIFLRAKFTAGVKADLLFAVDGAERRVVLEGTGDFALYEIYRGALKGQGVLAVLSNGIPGEADWDGFVFGVACEASEIAFVPSSATHPVAEKGPIPQSAVLRDADGSHFFWWSRPATEREYQLPDLAGLLNYSFGIRHPLYTPSDIQGGKQGGQYCKEAYILPVLVPAKGTQAIYAVYAEGDGEPAGIALDEASLEAIYLREKAKAFALPCREEGAGYRFSQQLMSAALMTNIKFPLRCRGDNVRHHSPDKYFNSLYSWDSGFIGLGLLELDKRRAIENLNVYVTEPGEENAFILHGTPLPVQSYLYHEIWNRFQDAEMLEYFYPRLKQNYDFLAGHVATSPCDKYATHLLQTWDCFYNSGGWDDYPPQWQMFKDRDYRNAPVVTTSHVIRFAKTLRVAARLLGTDDDASLTADIERFSDALQRYSWTEEDGVFSYVTHDAEGKAAGIYRDPESGANFNFGFDGVSPVIAGICDEKQRELLWARLSSPEHLWTPYGLTAVDQAAPYHRLDGYWNGAIWMPHQWFFWKAALDNGQAEFARRIAKTGLNVWKHETDQSYCTFEHFSAINGRGCGCHHFGGLSTPVLSWYAAYYTPGRLTTGMDCWVLSQQHGLDGSFEAGLQLEGGTPVSTVLYVPPKAGEYEVTYDGAIPAFRNVDGVLEIDLPAQSVGMLRIAPVR